MNILTKVIFFLSFLSSFSVCFSQPGIEKRIKTSDDIMAGAEQLTEYLPRLTGKTVAIVANQTSMIQKIHLVDCLQLLKVKIKCVFAPEHGFRGNVSAGEEFNSGMDERSGLRIVSLYGKHLKPTATDLEGVDVVLFDIQDVGVRFYTYISTLQYVMEACAEQNKELIVLDRPNPNGFYVDGPLLDKNFKSFVGMNQVPVVYGLTIGEYAMMLNGEHWLENGDTCKLTVIRLKNYGHSDLYQLPVKPSPNLPDMSSVYLYPSLCFFEGTRVSVGRGTQKPFRVIGYPGFTKGDFSFTPKSLPGIADHPVYEDSLCSGFNLEEFGSKFPENGGRIYLHWLKDMYDSYPEKANFFNNFFDKLAGTDQLRNQLTNGLSEKTIRSNWKEELKKFSIIRKKYLLYPDFDIQATGSTKGME